MEFEFTEIFDIPVLTELCESFTNINGVVTALLDLEGEVHIATGWQDLCTQFHRINPETSKRCTESDTALANALSQGSSYNVYKCKNGLVEVAVPVMIDDEHVANFFTGQFFFKQPDQQFFIQQAEEFSFDRENYIAALDKVPVYDENEVKRITDFLVHLTQIIGRMGKNNLLKLQAEEKSKQTQLKAHNEKLNDLKVQFKATFDQAAVGIAHVASDGSFLRINQKFCDIVGYTQEEMLSLTFQDITHPDDLNSDLEQLGQVIEDKIDTYSMEKRYFHKNGSIVWVNLTVSLIRDSSGKPDYFVSVVDDISKQIEIRNALDVQYSRLQNIIWGTNVGTWEWYVQTGKVEFNEKWAEMIGFTLSELQPITIETWTKYAHPDDLKRSSKELEKVFNREIDAYECEVRMQHRSGHWIWVLDRGKVVSWSDDGKALIMSGTHTDITALKEYEKQLESAVKERTQELVLARDKADVANLAKSRFLANMSHELRTPMHAIHSFTKLALKREIDSKARQFLENIDVSTDRLTNLLNDLLDLSKLESGKTELNLEEQDIRDLILTTINSLDSLIKEHNLVLDLSSLSLVKLQIDKNLMSQVITNLFSNAIKFSPDNGKIYVVSKVVDESCQVIIEDEGIGIPEDEYESIFDSFVQSSKTMTYAGGTGLGLPITKEIIELHQGEIWVESPPEGKNVGSIFTFKIPIKHFN